MADADAFRALTLLFAVCEQALLELDDEPPFPAELSERIAALRDLIYDTLDSDRFRRPTKD